MPKIKYNKNKNANIILREDMEYTGLEVKTLKKGEKYEEKIPNDTEACVVLLTGYAEASIGQKSFGEIGNRMSVFEDTVAYALYVAPNDVFKFIAKTDVEIAITKGIATGKYKSRLLEPKPNYIEHRGEGQTKRTAKNILPEQDDAESLLIVEVITHGGNWSSFPSHRHDEDDLPNQSLLEEIYYHKLIPKEKGFAFQRVYNDDETIDEAFTLKNNSVVLVKEGYHPVSVPPGCDLYYLNVMAGPKRTWKFHNDPTFEHLIK